MATELGIQFAVVTFVDADKKEVHVQSRLDGGIFTIQLDSPRHRQYMPVVNQQVLILVLEDQPGSNRFARIIAEFGEQIFDAPIQPGEVIFEGSGGGYLYLNQQGDAYLSDSAMSNVIKILSSVGISITGDKLSIDIKGIGQIAILNDKIEITKVAGKGGQPIAKISMTNDKIDIDNISVNIGKGPVFGGSVVSLAGVPGDHSIDFMTGLPIPGSATIKETI